VFFHSHIRQETEVVLLNDDSTAARTEFAFWTMFIEDQWRLHSAFLLFHYRMTECRTVSKTFASGTVTILY
jgi:hypothetical protein